MENATLQLIAILFAISPGLLGGAIGWSLGARSFPTYTGLKLIVLGAGGIIAFMGIAGLLRLAGYVGINPFTIYTPATLLLLAFLVAALACRPANSSGAPMRVKLHTLFPLALFSGLLVMAFIQHQNLPTTAWDTLDFWSPEAVRFIEYNLLHSDNTSSQFHYSHSYHHRHPLTIATLASWSGWISSHFGSSIGALLPWLFCIICICIMVFGYTYDVSGSSSFACLITYCAATIPLLENHGTLAGYAELWMTGLLAAAVTLAASSINHKRASLAILGTATATILIATKNTGAIFLMAFILAGCSFLLLKQSSKVTIAAFSLIAATALGIVFTGFNFSLSGREFSLVWGDTSYLTIPGLKMPLTFNPLVEVSKNELHSLIINQSFSILFLASTVTFIVAYKCSYSIVHRSAIFYITLVATLLLLMMIASQVLTSYALRHATPDHDTGNSRFSLPLSICLLLVCSHIRLGPRKTVKTSSNTASPQYPIQHGHKGKAKKN